MQPAPLLAQPVRSLNFIFLFYDLNAYCQLATANLMAKQERIYLGTEVRGNNHWLNRVGIGRVFAELSIGLRYCPTIGVEELPTYILN
jgi:hypothetical protein